MTSDDILRMAREAGATTVDQDDPQCWIGETAFDDDGLKRFAAIVAAAEREACAKVCESYSDDGWLMLQQDDCAAAIRASGQQ